LGNVGIKDGTGKILVYFALRTCRQQATNKKFPKPLEELVPDLEV